MSDSGIEERLVEELKTKDIELKRYKEGSKVNINIFTPIELSNEELTEALRTRGIFIAEGTWKGKFYSDKVIKALTEQFKSKKLPVLVEHGDSENFKFRSVGEATAEKYDPLLRATIGTVDVTDPEAIKLVQDKILRGYSIKGEVEVDPTSGDITGVDLMEISLVKDPACDPSIIMLSKEAIEANKTLNIATKEEISGDRMENKAVLDGKVEKEVELGSNPTVTSIEDRVSNLEKVIYELSREEDRKAQEVRSSRYGIGVKEGGHITKPSQYSNVPDSEFADPVNYRYPFDEAHVMAAWAYINKPENQSKGGYNDEEWSKMVSKVKSAMKKHGHEVAKHSVGEGLSTEDSSVSSTVPTSVSPPMAHTGTNIEVNTTPNPVTITVEVPKVEVTPTPIVEVKPVETKPVEAKPEIKIDTPAPSAVVSVAEGTKPELVITSPVKDIPNADSTIVAKPEGEPIKKEETPIVEAPKPDYRKELEALTPAELLIIESRKRG